MFLDSSVLSDLHTEKLLTFRERLFFDTSWLLHLISVGCLITVDNEAMDCRVIRKLKDDVGLQLACSDCTDGDRESHLPNLFLGRGLFSDVSELRLSRWPWHVH